jgi:hypothetical protein
MRGKRELCAEAPEGVDVGGTPTEILEDNPGREKVILFTTGASNIWLAWGNHTPAVGNGLVLKAKCGSAITIDRSNLITSRLVGITESGATQRVQVQRFSK